LAPVAQKQYLAQEATQLVEQVAILQSVLWWLPRVEAEAAPIQQVRMAAQAEGVVIMPPLVAQLHKHQVEQTQLVQPLMEAPEALALALIPVAQVVEVPPLRAAVQVA